ncbi:hypothetical protein [Candidatus Marithrix sp. Canyon 246]|uniref:hypothetical protein n=1 Tax=Candidatus Marithrix sp. Canyon 246 TaxID=1827136 RepID=UPI00084A0E56|nr:hypothetical protein [Candidatus Marithrix sp. Canyon 246]
MSKNYQLQCQEYLELKALLSDTSKLEDYLDYLHVKQVKKQTKKMFSLEEIKHELTQEEKQ